MAKKSSNKKTNNKSKVSKGKSKRKSVKVKGKATPKVNKGLNLYIRVRSVLWSEFKKDYKSSDYTTGGSPFLVVVGKVYRECRGRAGECTDDVLIEKYREITDGEQRVEPFIGRNLYEKAEPYWKINEIRWDLFEPYLWVVSPQILPAPHEFQLSEYVGVDGELTKGFEKFFKEWVDFNNDSEEINVREEGSEGNIPYYIVTKPEFNKKNKRWEIKIHIVTAGTEIDRRTKKKKDDLEGTDENLQKWRGWKTESFGFVPKGKLREPKTKKTLVPPSQKIKAAEPKPKKEAPTETATQKKLREAQIKKVQAETKKVEQETTSARIDNLNKKNDGLMKQMEMYSRLGNKKKVKSLEARIDITNLMIDKLLK